jgi:hypothetical protein
VYDLEAMKKRSSGPGRHLPYTLQFQIDIETFVMDETRLALSGKDGNDKRSVTVLNFANLNFAGRKSSNLKENPEANEGIDIRIVYGPCVDSFPY